MQLLQIIKLLQAQGKILSWFHIFQKEFIQYFDSESDFFCLSLAEYLTSGQLNVDPYASIFKWLPQG